MKHSKNTPKKHHYVPKSYLERFTNSDGFLHIFDYPRKQFRRAKPENVMTIRNYYHQSWVPDSINPYIFEIELGKDLEPKAKNAIDHLIKNSVLFNDDDSATLLTYLAFQRIRVPRQAETAKELMRKTIQNLVPNLIEKCNQEGLHLTIKDHQARFDYIRWTVGIFQQWFSRMEWEIITAEDGAAFISTDSPVSFYNPECPPPAEAGVALAGTIILFPLSSRYLLLMRHPECAQEHALKVLDTSILADGVTSIEYGKIWSHEVVTRTNWKLLQLAHHFVVAESDIVLQQCCNL